MEHLFAKIMAYVALITIHIHIISVVGESIGYYLVISNLFKFNLFKKISLNGYSGTNCQIAPYVPLNCNDVDPVNCPSYAAQNYCKNIYSINGITLPNYCAKSCYTFSIKIVLLLIKS